MAEYDWYTWGWMIWIGLFLVLESVAIVDKDPGDTFSEHVWKWFAIKGKGKGVKIRRLILVLFLTWLVIHLLTGGWI